MTDKTALTPASLLRALRGRVGNVLRGKAESAGSAATQPRNKHLWSIGVYSGTSVGTLMPDPRFRNPVLTRDAVTDISAAFVADPFLLKAGETWHMFFEAFNRDRKRGEIALAVSRNLAEWQYQQVVLAEPFHLSYPHVFEWEGDHYMIPETHQTRTIRLYRADPFPTRWNLIHTLMSGQRFADTTLFRHDNRWWLFTETSPQMKHDTLRLYSADDLLGRWAEHPSSPIVSGNPHAARPGGSVAITATGPVRFAQDCSPKFGVRVVAFQITKLSESEYEETEIPTNSQLGPSGSGWNADGMHHVNAHEVADGHWIAGVDGWIAATAANIAGTE